MAVLSKPLINLQRDRPLLTRYQERRIRQTFPFLSLPPELRNIIYDLCINLNGIEKFFNDFYRKVEFRGGILKRTIPPRNKKTPPILLINRQIFAEAISVLSKRSVNFDHGLLNLTGVQEVVSSQVLQRVTSINVTAHGHPILKSNIRNESWRGYMDLITYLSMILPKGHNLKNLTIDLEDKGLRVHAIDCWDDKPKCDFRDHLKEACNNLRRIRGVGCVTIKGVPPAVARELKALMQSMPISFLDLPGEIRNDIYELSADWSDVSRQLARTMEARFNSTHMHPPSYPKRSTPNVLLLNHQVRDEALSVLRSKPLNIVFPDDHNMHKEADVPNILEFISGNTLQTVKHMSIRIETWEWMYAIQGLADVLGEKHSLQSFHFYIKDRLKSKFVGVQPRKYPDSTLHKSLKGLKAIRGVPKVIIKGDLPDAYAKPLTQIMQTPAGTSSLPRLQALLADGSVENLDAD